MKNRISCFWSDNSGAVAIEFAASFLPVTIALIGTFETAWMMMVQNDMSRAAAETARYIRLGVARNWTVDQIRTEYCSHLWVVSCQTADIKIELHEMDTIAQASDAASGNTILSGSGNTRSVGNNACFKADGTSCTRLGSPALASGSTGSVMLMKVYGQFPGLARLWSPFLWHTSSGATILRVTQLFTTEPYDDSAP